MTECCVSGPTQNQVTESPRSTCTSRSDHWKSPIPTLRDRGRRGDAAQRQRDDGRADQGSTMYHPFIPSCRWLKTWQW